eukprot:7790850-Pyramimonas_sp.AAC.1
MPLSSSQAQVAEPNSTRPSTRSSCWLRRSPSQPGHGSLSPDGPSDGTSCTTASRRAAHH